MADVAIDADILGAMASHAPAHILIDDSLHLMHFANLPMTCYAIHLGRDMRLVSEEDISRSWNPVDSDPGRLFVALGIAGQFLDFGSISLDRVVARHASGDIGDRGVRGLIRVFMAKRAFQLRAVRLCDVYPMVVGNGLFGRGGS